MQKQYVIWHTAPAIDIALRLAHRRAAVEPSSQERRTGQTQDFRLETRAQAVVPVAVLAMGLVMLSSGTVTATDWLTIAGFLVTLSGTLLHGWSLCRER